MHWKGTECRISPAPALGVHDLAPLTSFCGRAVAVVYGLQRKLGTGCDVGITPEMDQSMFLDVQSLVTTEWLRFRVLMSTARKFRVLICCNEYINAKWL